MRWEKAARREEAVRRGVVRRRDVAAQQEEAGRRVVGRWGEAGLLEEVVRMVEQALVRWAAEALPVAAQALVAWRLSSKPAAPATSKMGTHVRHGMKI